MWRGKYGENGEITEPAKKCPEVGMVRDAPRFMRSLSHNIELSLASSCPSMNCVSQSFFCDHRLVYTNKNQVQFMYITPRHFIKTPGHYISSFPIKEL